MAASGVTCIEDIKSTPGIILANFDALICAQRLQDVEPDPIFELSNGTQAVCYDSGFSTFITHNSTIRISPSEHAIFMFLLKEAGRPVPSKRIVNELYGLRDEVSFSNTLQVLMARLRRKLSEVLGSENQPFILTIGAKGYLIPREFVSRISAVPVNYQGQSSIADKSRTEFSLASVSFTRLPYGGTLNTDDLSCDLSHLETLTNITSYNFTLGQKRLRYSVEGGFVSGKIDLSPLQEKMLNALLSKFPAMVSYEDLSDLLYSKKMDAESRNKLQAVRKALNDKFSKVLGCEVIDWDISGGLKLRRTIVSSKPVQHVTRTYPFVVSQVSSSRPEFGSGSLGHYLAVSQTCLCT